MYRKRANLLFEFFIAWVFKVGFGCNIFVTKYCFGMIFIAN